MGFLTFIMIVLTSINNFLVTTTNSSTTTWVQNSALEKISINSKIKTANRTTELLNNRDADCCTLFLTIVSSGYGYFICSLAKLKNGDLVSGYYDNTIKIWNVNDGSLKKILLGHTNFVESLTTLPNGDLVSGSWDKRIKYGMLQMIQ